MAQRRAGAKRVSLHKHDEFSMRSKASCSSTSKIGPAELGPRQAFVVPKGVTHRTRAAERTVMLMMENAGIIPTGT
jgi:hypothetical protein